MLIAGMTVVWHAMPTPITPPTTWQASPASGPIASVPVRNLGMVEHGILYRSAQPRASALPATQREWLAQWAHTHAPGDSGASGRIVDRME